MVQSKSDIPFTKNYCTRTATKQHLQIYSLTRKLNILLVSTIQENNCQILVNKHSAVSGKSLSMMLNRFAVKF